MTDHAHPLASFDRLIQALARQAVQDYLRNQANLDNDSDHDRAERALLQRTTNAA